MANGCEARSGARSTAPCRRADTWTLPKLRAVVAPTERLHAERAYVQHDEVRGPPGASADRPQGRAPARDQEVGRLGHDDRSQEDRDHVLGPHVRLLLPRRGRGADDAAAAQRAQQHADHLRALQPAADAARDDDGVPVRRAGVCGVWQLLRAVDDRRPGHGLPAAERAVVLAAAVRRNRRSTPPSSSIRPARAGGAIRRCRSRCTRPAGARTRGSSSSTSPASRRCSAPSTSTRRSSTCGRRA